MPKKGPTFCEAIPLKSDRFHKILFTFPPPPCLAKLTHWVPDLHAEIVSYMASISWSYSNWILKIFTQRWQKTFKKLDTTYFSFFPRTNFSAKSSLYAKYVRTWKSWVKSRDTVPLKVPKMVGVQKLSMITNFRKGLNNKSLAWICFKSL